MMFRPSFIVGLALAVVAGCSGESTSGNEGFQPEAPSKSGDSTGGGNNNGSGTGSKPDLGTPPEEGPPPVTDGDPILTSTTACTGEAGSIYELNVRVLASTTEVPLCRAKGRVLLIVNGASHCGYTPQYKPLQQLYAKHQAAGLSILAFPSKSFNQEDSDENQVSSFCTEENGITFPLFAIGPVVNNTQKNEVAQPVYQWLAKQPNMTDPVAWNFEKFLISKDGKVLKRFGSSVNPSVGSEIDTAIAEALK